MLSQRTFAGRQNERGGCERAEDERGREIKRGRNEAFDREHFYFPPATVKRSTPSVTCVSTESTCHSMRYVPGASAFTATATVSSAIRRRLPAFIFSPAAFFTSMWLNSSSMPSVN